VADHGTPFHYHTALPFTPLQEPHAVTDRSSDAH
jgi:hypothetical protein